MQLLFYDRDEHGGCYRAPDLRLHRVLTGLEKALHAQMVLDPLEEQFDTLGHRGLHRSYNTRTIDRAS
jgi:hypothetical protein